VRFAVPERGTKRKLMETVTQNATDQFRRHKLRRASDFGARSRALAELGRRLELEQPPLRIECYDISNLGPTDTVGSMVVFEDGLARKSEYRRFVIKGQAGIGDVASISEVIGRRFRLVHVHVGADVLDGSVDAAGGLDEDSLAGLAAGCLEQRLDEGERFLDGVDAAVRQHLDDPRAAVGAALELFLSSAGEDPLVRILLSDDGTGGMLPLVTTQGMPVVQWATARLTATIEEGWPQAPTPKVRLLAESLVRLAISYITAPSESPERTATQAGELLGPFIDEALGSAG